MSPYVLSMMRVVGQDAAEWLFRRPEVKDLAEALDATNDGVTAPWSVVEDLIMFGGTHPTTSAPPRLVGRLQRIGARAVMRATARPAPTNEEYEEHRKKHFKQLVRLSAEELERLQVFARWFEVMNKHDDEERGAATTDSMRLFIEEWTKQFSLASAAGEIVKWLTTPMRLSHLLDLLDPQVAGARHSHPYDYVGDIMSGGRLLPRQPRRGPAVTAAPSLLLIVPGVRMSTEAGRPAFGPGSARWMSDAPAKEVEAVVNRPVGQAAEAAVKAAAEALAEAPNPLPNPRPERMTLIELE